MDRFKLVSEYKLAGDQPEAVDKLVDSSQLNSDLTSIANAIRTKGGTSAQLAFPSGFVSAVEAIPSGGGSSVKYTRYTLTGDTTLNIGFFLSINKTEPISTLSPTLAMGLGVIP